jgi:hypothetical protein
MLGCAFSEARQRRSCAALVISFMLVLASRDVIAKNCDHERWGVREWRVALQVLIVVGGG